jgi:hypothetical protein
MNSGKHFSAECWLLAEWNYRAREGVLVVAADGPFSWATPAMLDGGKWATLNRNWFQEENHLGGSPSLAITLSGVRVPGRRAETESALLLCAGTRKPKKLATEKMIRSFRKA